MIFEVRIPSSLFPGGEKAFLTAQGSTLLPPLFLHGTNVFLPLSFAFSQSILNDFYFDSSATDGLFPIPPPFPRDKGWWLISYPLSFSGRSRKGRLKCAMIADRRVIPPPFLLFVVVESSPPPLLFSFSLANR